MRFHLLSLISLVLGTHAGMAQTAAPTPPRQLPSRWAVGLQLAQYPRIVFDNTASSQGTTYARPWPVMLTGRYHLANRFSFEAGLLLGLRPDRSTTDASGPSGTYTTKTHASSWAVPLLTRVQLSSTAVSRWQVDAEFGVLVMSSKYTSETTFTDAGTGQSSASGSGESEFNDLPLLVGVGGNYQLTPHLDLTANARFSWSYLASAVGSIFLDRSYTAPVNSALSAGLSYRFGDR